MEFLRKTAGAGSDAGLAAFLEKSKQAYLGMMRDEKLVTFDQREERAVQEGQLISRLLLEHQLADDAAVRPAAHGRHPSTDADLHEAAHWLYSALSAGPVASNTIHENAKQNGISRRNLHIALRYLHGECTKEGFQGMWFWRLRGDTRAPSDGTDRFLLKQASLLDDLDGYSRTKVTATIKSNRAPPVPA